MLVISLILHHFHNKTPAVTKERSITRKRCHFLKGSVLLHLEAAVVVAQSMAPVTGLVELSVSIFIVFYYNAKIISFPL